MDLLFESIDVFPQFRRKREVGVSRVSISCAVRVMAWVMAWLLPVVTAHYYSQLMDFINDLSRCCRAGESRLMFRLSASPMPSASV